MGLVMVLSIVFWETCTLISTVPTSIHSKERFLSHTLLSSICYHLFFWWQTFWLGWSTLKIVLTCICPVANVDKFLKNIYLPCFLFWKLSVHSIGISIIRKSTSVFKFYFWNSLCSLDSSPLVWSASAKTLSTLRLSPHSADSLLCWEKPWISANLIYQS